MMKSPNPPTPCWVYIFIIFFLWFAIWQHQHYINDKI